MPKKIKPALSAADFRAELVKLLPGYSWTVHNQYSYVGGYICATGIQTSGFNRLSTLQVVKRGENGVVEYEVKSSGFGKNAPWLSAATDGTLARAMRSLQSHYESMAATYRSHATAIQDAREHRHG